MAECDLELIIQRESVARETLEKAQAQVPAIEAALAEAERLAIKMNEVLASVGMEMEGASSQLKMLKQASPAEKVAALAEKLSAMKVEMTATTEAVSAKRVQLQDKKSDLALATSACNLAKQRAIELRQIKEQVASECGEEIELALAARLLADQGLRDLEAESAAAAERVSSRIKQRQLLDIKRWLSLEGPSKPLNLKW